MYGDHHMVNLTIIIWILIIMVMISIATIINSSWQFADLALRLTSTTTQLRWDINISSSLTKFWTYSNIHLTFSHCCHQQSCEYIWTFRYSNIRLTSFYPVARMVELQWYFLSWILKSKLLLNFEDKSNLNAASHIWHFSK